MPCQKVSDEHGTLYRVPAYAPKEPVKGMSLTPRSHVDVWWDREAHPKRYDEEIIIRQENGTDRADVITITLGQVYDLIHALGALVMDK